MKSFPVVKTALLPAPFFCFIPTYFSRRRRLSNLLGCLLNFSIYSLVLSTLWQTLRYLSHFFHWSHILGKFRLGAACPANYNPADHFIQLLAGVPGREEATKHTIDTVCTAFGKSEIGCKIAAEAENALFREVRREYFSLTFLWLRSEGSMHDSF